MLRVFKGLRTKLWVVYCKEIYVAKFIKKCIYKYGNVLYMLFVKSEESAMINSKDDEKYVRASLKIALRLKREPEVDLDALIDEEARRNSLDKHKLARYFAQNQQVWMGTGKNRER